MKFKWIAVLSLCMLSSTQNNHLTSARFLDKNTNQWWALGILLLHTAACHSWACHESGFLALLQGERSGLMSDCWKTSPRLTPLFLNPQKLSRGRRGPRGACCSKGRIWTSEWKAQGRQMWGSDQERLSRLELPSPHVDCPSYGCRGLWDLPVPGMAEVAGPPDRVSVSSEGEPERRHLIRILGFPTILKVEIRFKGFLPSGFQIIETFIGISSYCRN